MSRPKWRATVFLGIPLTVQLSTLRWMTYLLWTASFVLVALFIWVASMNAWVLFVDLRGDSDPPSSIPLFGGLMGAAGLWLMPVEGAAHWFWLPLVLDYGCAPVMLFTAYRLFSRSSK